MEASFWHKKWGENDIGFHQSETDPLLLKHFNKLSLDRGSRVFVPLCGKTRDIAWFLSKGHDVVGCELNGAAVEELFSELGVSPSISTSGALEHYSAPGIDIFVGNFFDLTAEQLGTVDGVYDRAALEALPSDMRNRYKKHLLDITHESPQLLLCYEYDQSLLEGPPFSINEEEVRRHYIKHYDVNLIDSVNGPGGVRGQCAGMENVWILKNE